MATINKARSISITLEFEPIVKLMCWNFDCEFNCANENGDDAGAYCLLKHIEITPEGKCKHFKEIKKDDR